MAEIKTVLTPDRILEIWKDCHTAAAKEFFNAVRPDGVTGKDSVPVRFARAIERAVLEAAPASSAMAMQAVDTVSVPRELFDELIDMAQYEASAYHLSHKGYKPEQHAQRDKVIADARSLQSQQSPVQAIDAGKV